MRSPSIKELGINLFHPLEDIVKEDNSEDPRITEVQRKLKGRKYLSDGNCLKCGYALHPKEEEVCTECIKEEKVYIHS